MTAITRLGDFTTGHGCFPARPSIAACHSVFANDIPVIILGDSEGVYAIHCCGSSCHGGYLSGGSPNVFVEDQPVGRIADPISCGDHVGVGSPDCFCN